MTSQDLRVTLVTAGLGSLRWKAAAARLARQARSLGWFANVRAYDQRGLVTALPDFWRQHGSFVTANERGYGYWLWRPFIVRRELETSNADVVVFLDAGCEINAASQASSRFRQYCDFALEQGFMAMRTEFPLAQWCKRDLLDETGLLARSAEIKTVEPGVSLYHRTASTMDLLDAWIDLATRDRYHFLDDSPSTRPNVAGFVEHRHDQSILTCLLAERQGHVIPQESYFPGSWLTDGAGAPFWVTRNRWPVRIGSGGPWGGIVQRVRRRRASVGTDRE